MSDPKPPAPSPSSPAPRCETCRGRGSLDYGEAGYFSTIPCPDCSGIAALVAAAPPSSPETRARCAGCSVHPPFEHRCHGAPCPCRDCDNHNFASPPSSREGAPPDETVCCSACDAGHPCEATSEPSHQPPAETDTAGGTQRPSSRLPVPTTIGCLCGCPDSDHGAEEPRHCKGAAGPEGGCGCYGYTPGTYCDDCGNLLDGSMFSGHEESCLAATRAQLAAAERERDEARDRHETFRREATKAREENHAEALAAIKVWRERAENAEAEIQYLDHEAAAVAQVLAKTEVERATAIAERDAMENRYRLAGKEIDRLSAAESAAEGLREALRQVEILLAHEDLIVEIPVEDEGEKRDRICIACGSGDPHAPACPLGQIAALSSRTGGGDLAPWYEADGSIVMLPAAEVGRRRKLAAKVIAKAAVAVREYGTDISKGRWSDVLLAAMDDLHMTLRALAPPDTEGR